MTDLLAGDRQAQPASPLGASTGSAGDWSFYVSDGRVPQNPSLIDHTANQMYGLATGN